ncbi:unnamed protein product [Anisakis simplex]|uniref:Uncharacterized protein n=1 Tax=Anisakis simplex TaxID=6269 RepID=A0A0M3JHI4_ANISI|nr:unnamed protein product [Anisakis simplex]
MFFPCCRSAVQKFLKNNYSSGGRSTVSENVEESGASERPSSPSKSTKAASDAVNSSRRLRSEKKIAKNEPTSTVVSTGKVEKKQSEECVKDKQQESETPTVRETRRTRRSTESAVNNPPGDFLIAVHSKIVLDTIIIEI